MRLMPVEPITSPSASRQLVVHDELPLPVPILVVRIFTSVGAADAFASGFASAEAALSPPAGFDDVSPAPESDPHSHPAHPPQHHSGSPHGQTDLAHASSLLDVQDANVAPRVTGSTTDAACRSSSERLRSCCGAGTSALIAGHRGTKPSDKN